MPRLFFATDVHGSEIFWKKFLNAGKFYKVDVQQVRDMERRVGSRGYYPFRTTPEQLSEFAADPAKVDAFFHEQMLGTLRKWMMLADERLEGSDLKCYVCPGNDVAF